MANTGPAHEAHKRYTDERAASDPVRLARATRTVKHALSTHRLTIDELIATAPPLSDEQVDKLRALLPAPTADGVNTPAADAS